MTRVLIQQDIDSEVSEITSGHPLYQPMMNEVSAHSITPSTFEQRKVEVHKPLGDLLTKVKSLQKDISTTITELTSAELVLGNMTEIQALISKGTLIQKQVDGARDTFIQTSGIKEKKAVFETQRSTLEKYTSTIDAYNRFCSNDTFFLVYEDLYSQDENCSVLRYGINTAVIAIDNSKMLGIDISMQPIATASQTESGSKVSSKKNKDKKEQDGESANKLLHPLELELLHKAIETLVRTDTTTILLDVFERCENSCAISISENGQPKKHTVLLYKKQTATTVAETQILVIDPSNSNYTKHLSDPLLSKIVGHSIGSNISILTPKDQVRIYRPEQEAYKPENEQENDDGSEISGDQYDQPTGPGINQYRNCVDICAKLAFEFSTLPQDTIVDIDNLMSLRAVLNVTNYNTCAPKTLHDEVTKCNNFVNIKKLPITLTSEDGYFLKAPIRIKQTTKPEIRFEFNRLIEKCITQISSTHQNDSDTRVDREIALSTLLMRAYAIPKRHKLIDSLKQIINDNLKLLSHLQSETLEQEGVITVGATVEEIE